MRNLLILLALMLLPALTLAQTTDTVVDVLAADPDARFITLVAAVEAAGLADTLSDPDATFTIFAPTDAAFDAALAQLDLTRAELLADTDLLTTILTYHVVPAVVTAANLAERETVTTAQGEDLTIAAGVPVQINDATVLEADRTASNGVVHVIDTVLLPPTLAADLAAVAAASGLAEDTTLADAGARIRFAHLSPDTPIVDVYLDGERVAEGLELLDVTDWLPVTAGAHELVVTPADTDIEQIAVGPLDFTFDTDSWQTISLIGSLGATTLTAVIVPEDYTPIAPGDTRVTIFHAIEDAPVVDVVFDRNIVIVAQLAYPNTVGANDGAFTLDTDSRTRSIQVIRTGTLERVAVAATPFAPGDAESPLLIEVVDVELEENVNYLVAAVGVMQQPELLIVPTGMDAVLPSSEDTAQE